MAKQIGEPMFAKVNRLASKEFVLCQICGRVVHESELVWSDDWQGYYCPQCHDDGQMPMFPELVEDW